MTIDGIALAAARRETLARRLAQLGRTPVLAIITCAPDFATKRYLAIKERRAAELGVSLRLCELPAQSETAEVVRILGEQVRESDGIIVQLPLPGTLDIEAVLTALPRTHDVDAVGAEAQEALACGEEQEVLSPVVGAIRAIAEDAGLSFSGKRAVVIGRGRLVGAPAAAWLVAQGAEVVVCTEETRELRAQTRAAEVLVLGAGAPGLITPDMVKQGAAVFDAGTSEAGGKLAGDAAPEVAEVAGLFTPVPGGIGPLTVVALFENLATLMERRGRVAANLL